MNKNTQSSETVDVKTVTETNTEVNPTTETKTETTETSKTDNTIPYSRFKEVNDAKKDLESKLKELQTTIDSLSNEKAESVNKVQKELLDKMNAITSKYEQNVLETSGAKDPEYVKFLINKEVANGVDYLEAIKSIKTTKPDLFKKTTTEQTSTPGHKPTSSAKVTSEMFVAMSKEERRAAIKAGYMPNN